MKGCEQITSASLPSALSSGLHPLVCCPLRAHGAGAFVDAKS